MGTTAVAGEGTCSRTACMLYYMLCILGNGLNTACLNTVTLNGQHDSQSFSACTAQAWLPGQLADQVAALWQACLGQQRERTKMVHCYKSPFCMQHAEH